MLEKSFFGGFVHYKIKIPNKFHTYNFSDSQAMVIQLINQDILYFYLKLCTSDAG